MDRDDRLLDCLCYLIADPELGDVVVVEPEDSFFAAESIHGAEDRRNLDNAIWKPSRQSDVFGNNLETGGMK